MTNVDFVYTESFFPDSSFVEAVYLNENENYAVLDLNDRLYRYDNVDREAVEELTNNSSVGRYYGTTWKHKYGPATSLGYEDDTFYYQVDVDSEPDEEAEEYEDYSAVPSFVQNEWTDNTATREVSLQPVADATASTAAVASAPAGDTKEVSLDTPAVAGDGLNDYQITFLLGTAQKTHNVRASFLREALDTVEDIFETFEVDAEVIEVALLG